MHRSRYRVVSKAFFAVTILQIVSYLAAQVPAPAASPDSSQSPPPVQEQITELDAWTAVARMTPGINIGNTLENTTRWETGWGNPPITREYVHSLARLGFKTVRLPVAWDTYAENGRIQPDKFRRVAEVVDWINDAGMFCVLNIHWDSGWIDSDVKEKYPKAYHTFTAEAETKFRSYWEQISRFFADKDEKLIFEALNEESNFDNEGSPEKAYATLTRVNQLFIDTVRQTGGNNARRLLIVAGYTTDFAKTCSSEFKMPTDTIPGRLFISVHYYTPWPFVGMDKDESWGKMMKTWGSPDDVRELSKFFNTMNDFCVRNNTPAFVGEFDVVARREAASRVRWMTAVGSAAIARKMVPVIWDTGGEVSRREPYAATPELIEILRNMPHPTPGSSAPAR
jgi:endoglucanase